MTSAKELLVKYMDLIKDPERATSLFAADAAVEIPYLVDVGLPGKFKGHDGILAFLRQLNTLFPDVAFTNLQVCVDTPDKWLANTSFTVLCQRLKGIIINCFLAGLWQAVAKSLSSVRR